MAFCDDLNCDDPFCEPEDDMEEGYDDGYYYDEDEEEGEL